MKIIIAGTGKVGTSVAKILSTEGHDLTVIDMDAKAVQYCEEHYDVIGIIGNCAVRETLEKAGAVDARLLIAAADSDEINLLTCMTAHAINPSLHTIARIRNPEYYSQIYMMKEQFGLSMMVNPELQAAREIDRLLKYPGFLKVDTFAKGRVDIVELKIEENSKLAGIRMMDLNTVIKCKVLVCAVLRDRELMIPDGRFTLETEDRIFVTAPAENLTKLLKNLGIITHKARRVMICGGGKTSFYLADLLEKSDVKLEIIERDKERCTQLAALLPNVSVLCGDATSTDMLEGENVSGCDALISLTGMDEMNIIISLYGQTHGIPQIITKIGRVEDSRVLDCLPLGSMIAPKDLCCSSIVRYVRAMNAQTGGAEALHFIADGKAEALEFRITEGVKNIGIPLKSLQLKKNMLISCITHDGVTEIPGGDSHYELGDSVIVVTGNSSAVVTMNDIFA